MFSSTADPYFSLPHRRRTLTVGIAVLLAWCPLAAKAQPASALSPLTLDGAVAIALAQNPDLDAVSARSRALEAVPTQLGSLPDPMLSLGALNLPTDTFDPEQEPMTQMRVGITQSIPFPGKRRLREDAARSEFRASEAHVDERRDVTVRQVRIAWWRLFSVDRALEIVERNQDLMRDFVAIAQTKYTVGNGLQQDVLLAQLELSKLLDRESRLKSRRRSALAELNGLLDRRPDHEIRLPHTGTDDELPEPPTEAELLIQAQESRHLLGVHRELLQAANERVALAERDRLPDFSLGAAYGIRNGEDPVRGDRADFFSVLFSMNLPIYARGKQSKAIEQRRSEREERVHLLASAARAIETEIGRSLADYEGAREQVALLNGAIIPQAEQTVASMLAGYQVNEVDFLNVVNGQLTLYNAQISYWNALSNAKSALAALAAAVGSENLYE
jgi:outer membrane protein TolC